MWQIQVQRNSEQLEASLLQYSSILPHKELWQGSLNQQEVGVLCAGWLPLSIVEEKRLHWEQPKAHAAFPAGEGKRNERVEMISEGFAAMSSPATMSEGWVANMEWGGPFTGAFCFSWPWG